MKIRQTLASCFVALGIVLAAVSAAPMSGCTSCADTASQCDVVNADFTIKGTIASLVGAKVTICINGTCTDGELAGTSTVCDKTACVTGAASAASATDLVCGPVAQCAAQVPGTNEVALNVAVPFPANHKNGDLYAVTIVATDGTTVLAHREGKVSYQEEHLQGAFCPACEQGTL